MTVGLLTITYDAPVLLPKMLDSVRDLIDGPKLAFHVGEHAETADILSSDGFEVERRPWENFDGSWTELFGRAYAHRRRPDRWLYLQENCTLEIDGDLPANDDETPCWMIRYRRGTYQYRLPNLLRSDVQWSITGQVHGHLDPDFSDTRRTLDALVVQETDADGRRPEKLARYLPICEAMYAEQPDDPRIVFYLARSYFDFGRYEEAIELFDKRLRMGGWDEELFISQYVKGLAHIQLGQYGEGRLALLNAYLRRPSRAEPLYMMAKSMLPPEEDILFIEPRCYGPET